MGTYRFKGKTYTVDNENFLVDHNIWDENFAVGMARKLGLTGDLTERHWEVIRFIRNRFKETGICPVVHETMRSLGLDLASLQELFPTGYLRGACLLAGITYMYGWVYCFGEPYPVGTTQEPGGKRTIRAEGKVYRVDQFGSLVDPSEWDENFAVHRAYEMKMQTGLTEKHWQIIKFLRDAYTRDKKAPTIYECCKANHINIEKFAELFPTGYHRGATKIAGLPTLGREPR